MKLLSLSLSRPERSMLAHENWRNFVSSSSYFFQRGTVQFLYSADASAMYISNKEKADG